LRQGIMICNGKTTGSFCGDTIVRLVNHDQTKEVNLRDCALWSSPPMAILRWTSFLYRPATGWITLFDSLFERRYFCFPVLRRATSKQIDMRSARYPHGRQIVKRLEPGACCKRHPVLLTPVAHVRRHTLTVFGRGFWQRRFSLCTRFRRYSIWGASGRRH
jgi:hypothetical protein